MIEWLDYEREKKRLLLKLICGDISRQEYEKQIKALAKEMGV